MTNKANAIRPMARAAYEAIDAVNATLINAGYIDGEFSPAHFRHARLAPRESTPQMDVGTATHLVLLEPAEFDRRVVKAPVFDRRTKVGKEAAAAFEAEHAGRLVLDPETYAKVDGMRASILDDAKGKRLVSHFGLVEQAVTWTDAEFGLPCKGLMDKYVPGRVIVDLKTIGRKASLHRLRTSIFDHGYHRQMAHYLAGVRSAGADAAGGCWWIFVESDPPHAVRVLKAEPMAIEIGMRENRHALAAIAACQKAGAWPAYGMPGIGRVEEIGLPEWVYRRSQLEVIS